MHFKNISISEWQQFDKVELDFSNQLTILTGANGSGKTSLLNILARHSGWQQPSYSLPKKLSDVIENFTRYFHGEDKSKTPKIGDLKYSDGTSTPLNTQKTGSVQYHLSLPEQKEVDCFYIPSHRAVPKYMPISSIPTSKKQKRDAFEEVFSTNRERYFGNSNQSAAFMMKSTLIGWATQGYGIKTTSGDVVMPSDLDLAKLFEGFPKTLQKLLPKSLGFEKIEIRNSEIVFVCNGGKDEFLLETASGGIYALIDIAWQIYMFSAEDSDRFTVIIDEVENHLHPTMQRQILGDLMVAFPQARFIVSTHSPLVVSSVRDAKVYALKYNSRKKIESSLLDFSANVKTATEILDEVLGVSSSIPLWAENELSLIASGFSKKNLTKDDFDQLRLRLKNLGLERLMPRAIAQVLDDKTND